MDTAAEVEVDKRIILFSVGNPGPMNRHSLGHFVLGEIVKGFAAKQLVKPSGRSQYAMSQLDNLTFVKSAAYMNESNKSINSFVTEQKISLNQCVLIVVYDDFESDLTRVKLSPLKKNESHNGLKAVQKFLTSQALQTALVYKLGIGIGPKPASASKDTMASWVLSKVPQADMQLVQDKSLPTVFGYINHIMETSGVIKDCNKLNARMKKEYED